MDVHVQQLPQVGLAKLVQFLHGVHELSNFCDEFGQLSKLLTQMHSLV